MKLSDFNRRTQISNYLQFAEGNKEYIVDRIYNILRREFVRHPDGMTLRALISLLENDGEECFLGAFPPPVKEEITELLRSQDPTLFWITEIRERIEDLFLHVTGQRDIEELKYLEIIIHFMDENFESLEELSDKIWRLPIPSGWTGNLAEGLLGWHNRDEW